MAIEILLPLLVSVIGLVIYLAAITNTKVTEAGRLMFACGMLVTLFEVATRYVHV